MKRILGIIAVGIQLVSATQKAAKESGIDFHRLWAFVNKRK
ncbi:hypothetical protein [Parasporobacterium paucivorans]|nr:hypothetical protein [Parasporobacterium paucivorans]